jgi:hypothetical protein
MHHAIFDQVGKSSGGMHNRCRPRTSGRGPTFLRVLGCRSLAPFREINSACQTVKMNGTTKSQIPPCLPARNTMPSTQENTANFSQTSGASFVQYYGPRFGRNLWRVSMLRALRCHVFATYSCSGSSGSSAMDIAQITTKCRGNLCGARANRWQADGKSDG